jgi:antitoxin CptB
MPTCATSNAAPPMPDDGDTLRRKLAFRAWHRGTSEADLLIGGFADQCLMAFTAEDLGQFERLLQEDDPDIDDWIAGRRLVPKQHDNKVMALLRRFCLAFSTPPPRGSKSLGTSGLMS